MTIIAPVDMTPRNDATFSCWSRYSGDRKLREYKLPTRSTSTTHPNAHATAGSMRQRAMAPRGVTLTPDERASAIELETVADAQEAQRPAAHCRHKHRALK